MKAGDGIRLKACASIGPVTATIGIFVFSDLAATMIQVATVSTRWVGHVLCKDLGQKLVGHTRDMSHAGARALRMGSDVDKWMHMALGN